MALQILTATEYPAVRAAIDTSLDAAVLPDPLIEQPIYGEAAEAEVLARDPLALDYASGPGADAAKWARVVRAAIYLTAARLCLALPNVTGERLGDYQVSLAAPDLGKRVAALRGLADRELSAYLETDGQAPVLTAFARACGSRGR